MLTADKMMSEYRHCPPMCRAPYCILCVSKNIAAEQMTAHVFLVATSYADTVPECLKDDNSSQ